MAALAMMFPVPTGSLEDALRAALRASAHTSSARCLVCHTACTRTPAGDGAQVVECGSCGSTLELAPPPPPHLALVD